MTNAYDDYGMTAPQLHCGLDKLWKALGLVGVQNRDVFTLAAEAIETSYALLDHRHEADQLRHRVLYSTREQAQAEAAKMRTCTGCPLAAIEVVALRRAEVS